MFGGSSSQSKRQSVQMAAHPGYACTLVLNYLAVGISNLLPVNAMCEVGIDLAGPRLVRTEALDQIIRL